MHPLPRGVFSYHGRGTARKTLVQVLRVRETERERHAHTQTERDTRVCAGMQPAPHGAVCIQYAFRDIAGGAQADTLQHLDEASHTP